MSEIHMIMIYFRLYFTSGSNLNMNLRFTQQFTVNHITPVTRILAANTRRTRKTCWLSGNACTFQARLPNVCALNRESMSRYVTVTHNCKVATVEQTWPHAHAHVLAPKAEASEIT